MKPNERTERRRGRLLTLLRRTDQPLSGTVLARRLRISRQIIVQDIAVLRASGEQILSTPRGYVLWQPEILATGRNPALTGAKPRNAVPRQPEMSAAHQAVIVSKHGKKECEEELLALVDLGVKVVDVFVEHPIYGEIRRRLMIRSPQDVRDFMERLKQTGAELLCELTGGVHLHTLEAPRVGLLEKARQVLRDRGFLVE